ncbi:unnamed protein product [Caenorhabditis angaria]|uniref:Nucleotide-diphospho-sugar transferase domain-containing protein n=1 Tax=Caenorhabditis angaria TaxID=860376 RepID=A0A9P1IW32_9PELO|nr:unnamed protein product [Caenorhabditis angaria]
MTNGQKLILFVVFLIVVYNYSSPNFCWYSANSLRIAIVVVVSKGTDLKNYEIALNSLECYARTQKYNFIIAIDSDYESVCKQKNNLFRRHCIVTKILPNYDALLFLDADIGVVNPTRRIEEFLEEGVDVTFYDRFFNVEIATGSYILRNTPYAVNLINGFADYESKLPNSFHGADNGAFHMYLAHHLFPYAKTELKNCQKIWNNSKNFADVFIYESCIRTMLGASTNFGKIKIFRKAEGWVRDAWLTGGMWSQNDFMLHGWKTKQLKNIPKNGISSTRMNYNQWYSPFLGQFDISKCSPSNLTWIYNQKLIGKSEHLKESLEEYEQIVAKELFDNGIAIVVVVSKGTDPKNYEIALNSLECYAKTQNYDYILAIDSDYDAVCKQNDKLFRRHCVVTKILPNYDALLFLDADIGVVNPKRRIEEFLEDGVDVTFYDRFFNVEIAIGSYILRNTPYAINLINGFADYESKLPNSFHGTENGAIHMYLAQHLFPYATIELENCQKIWNNSKNFADVFIYESCIRTMLGASTNFGKIKVFRKAEGWVRDAWLTGGMWSQNDFMLHGWKTKQLKNIPKNGISSSRMNYNQWYSPFSGQFDISKCSPSNLTWMHKSELVGKSEDLKDSLITYQKIVAKELFDNGYRKMNI